MVSVIFPVQQIDMINIMRIIQFRCSRLRDRKSRHHSKLDSSRNDLQLLAYLDGRLCVDIISTAL